MKSSAAKIQLTSYEELLKPHEGSNGPKERVQEIEPEELFPFKDHPFKVQDDETMQEMAESIKEYGSQYRTACPCGTDSQWRISESLLLHE